MKILRLKERGSIALILVLTVIMIVSVVVLEINFRSQLTANIVTNRRDSIKAYELAMAGVRWSMFRLQLDRSLDKIPAIPGTNYGGKKDDLMEMQWAFPITYPFPVATGIASAGSLGDSVSTKIADPKDMQGSFISAIEDESAKINLNDVGSGGPPGQVAWSGPAEVLENLLLSPRFRLYFQATDHRQLLWAIDDWIDSDTQINHLGGGVEDAEYQTDNPDLRVKNGPFYTLDEVRLLKPMTDELFRELRPFITIYPFNAKIPRLSITPVTETGKINVNTAPLELIAALFSQQAVPAQNDRLECALQFVKSRETMVYRSIKNEEPSFFSFLQQICRLEISGEGVTPAISPAVQKVLSIRSDIFSVEATGMAGETESPLRKTIRTVIDRSNQQSPKILYWKVI